MSRKSLYMIFKDSTGRKLHEKLSFMEAKLREMTKCPHSEAKTLSHDLKHFKSDFKEKWRSANYTEKRFLIKNEEWLKASIQIHTWSSPTTPRPGRPVKHFLELSVRSKLRKTKELREQVPVDELTYAASVSQRTSGNVEVSKFIKDVTVSPTRAKRFRKAIVTAETKTVNKHSPSEALAIFVEGDFTKKQWEILHVSNKSIFPCYSLIKEAKKDCYPREESMLVTETCVEVRLQDLLNHTVTRLCKYLQEVLENCTQEELKHLELITKWGCDGSQQSQFQQKFTNTSDDDSNIFQSSLVPLRLQTHIGDQKKILWQNPTPSSTRFCRPIRIRFLHETVDITKE